MIAIRSRSQSLVGLVLKIELLDPTESLDDSLQSFNDDDDNQKHLSVFDPQVIHPRVTDTGTKANYTKSDEEIMTLMTLISPIARKKNVAREERQE